MEFLHRVSNKLKTLQNGKDIAVVRDKRFTDDDLFNIESLADETLRLSKYKSLEPNELAEFASNVGNLLGMFLSYIEPETSSDPASGITNKKCVTCIIIVPETNQFALGHFHTVEAAAKFRCEVGESNAHLVLVILKGSKHSETIQGLRISWNGNGSSNAKRFRDFQLGKYPKNIENGQPVLFVFAEVHELTYDIIIVMKMCV